MTDPTTGALKTDLEALLARIAELETALRAISGHWACQYDHPRKQNEMYAGPYGIGVTDGHRAAAVIADAALDHAPPSDRTAP